MKEGLTKGKALAKDVAGKAVQMGLEKLGVPESAMGTATALAGEAFDRLGDAAERKAQSAIIGKAPTTMPAVPNKPREECPDQHGGRKRRQIAPYMQKSKAVWSFNLGWGVGSSAGWATGRGSRPGAHIASAAEGQL